MIAPGTRFGPYEIVAPIGAGGMGEVWRGRDTRLDRSVAIKLLPSEFGNDAQLKVRFEREARAISQLNHPNICTLYDVGDSYLVMELLDGQSLADRLERGPMSMAEVLRYGSQIADALDKAHGAGIVHRDLKPGNIMITKNGAKLLDFGLAKASAAALEGGGASEATAATQHKPLTQEGTIIGTFQYMAPEQLEGVEADTRTDLFALGTVLYEMATGIRAFSGKTRTSLIAAIVSGEPKPIHAIQPLTPPAFEHVVQKCLEKNPDDRWQCAHDVAEQLRWIAVSAPATPKKKATVVVPWVLAAILASTLGVVAYRWTRPQPRPQYRFAVPGLDATYKYAGFARLTADGRTLLFRASPPSGPPQVFRRSLDDLRTTPIEGTQSCTTFIMTPDGRSLLAAFPGAIVKRIPIDGGPPQVLTDAAVGGAGLAVAGDGSVLLASGTNPIRRIGTGGKLEKVLDLDAASGETAHENPVFLPDGKRFLFASVHRDSTQGTIKRTLKAATLGSPDVITIGEVSSRVDYAVGHLFYVREGILVAQRFDAATLKMSGDPITVAENISFNSRLGAAAFSAAADGTIAFQAPAFGIRAVFVDRSGVIQKTVGRLTSTANRGFTLVHDPERVIMSIPDMKAGSASLWVFGLTRETATRVTFSGALEFAPVAAPDGARVFFTSDPGQGLHIYEAPIDGSTPPKLVVSAANNQIPNDVTADNRFLIYQSNQNQAATKQDLWILPLAGDAKPYPFVATPAIEANAVFSPDGKWVAYHSDATGAQQVYVKPFPGPGAARIVSTGGGGTPRFSRDGKRLFFCDDNRVMVADFHDGNVTEPRMLFQMPDRVIWVQEVGDRYLMQLQNDSDASPPIRIITGWRPPA